MAPSEFIITIQSKWSFLSLLPVWPRRSPPSLVVSFEVLLNSSSSNDDLIFDLPLAPWVYRYCYKCDSLGDTDCWDNPKQTVLCGIVDGIGLDYPERCLTIQAKGTDPTDTILVRKCGKVNDCKTEVKNGTFASPFGPDFTNARCSECQGDFCNKNTLFDLKK